MKNQIVSCNCGRVITLPKEYNPEYLSALGLIFTSFHLAEKSTPANLRRAIKNAERMINGEDYEPYD